MTIKKIKETRSWFFKKINKIERPLATFSKKKEDSNTIINERGAATDTTQTPGIVRLLTIICQNIGHPRRN